jgi:hypothetical protein
VQRGTAKGLMSESGQQRTCRTEIAMSALPLKADIRLRYRDVSFGPFSDELHRSK